MSPPQLFSPQSIYTSNMLHLWCVSCVCVQASLFALEISAVNSEMIVAKTSSDSEMCTQTVCGTRKGGRINRAMREEKKIRTGRIINTTAEMTGMQGHS